MSPASVKLIHAVLHKALKQAQMWRLVRENVAEATVRPKRRRDKAAGYRADEGSA
jgi:hypothetical protein